MVHQDNDAGWWRKTGETCDHDGCDAAMIRYTTSDARKCLNGHRPEVTLCDDCGEEVMETHLGDFCGC